ncbi:MAG: hypothetical protein HYV37_01715 [Candidatus Levyibacteriota bacterium]|nr:MAG: hypothetical protein HYV37_01715 [Candidatus Levybacteria bacterium]
MQRIIISLIGIFLIWRVLLFVPLFIGQQLFIYRQAFDYTNIWKFIKPYEPVNNILLYPWANFDGVYYLAIAGGEYTKDNAGFFPAFPLLINVIHLVLGGGQTYGLMQFFSALFIVNIVFILSLYAFYKLLRFDYDHSTSTKIIILLLIFPTSFYFVSIYSEGLFFLLTVLSFYFARKRQWFFAGICGMFLTATRIVGVAIFPALVYELYFQEKTFKTKKIINLFFIPIGIVSYGVFNLVSWGNFFHFLQAHGTLGNGRSTDSLVLFPQTIFRYIKIIFSVSPDIYEWWIALLELVIFIVAMLLIYLGFKKLIRLSYLVFAAIAFLIPVFSGTFSGLPRYVIVLFPLFITLALINKKWIHVTYVVCGIILSFLLLMLFSRGYFIA